jgi:hypothetical protein
VLEREADVVEPLEQAASSPTVPARRSTWRLYCLPAAAAVAARRNSSATSASSSRIGTMPFWKQLLKKMSAKVGAITTRKP